MHLGKTERGGDGVLWFWWTSEIVETEGGARLEKTKRLFVNWNSRAGYVGGKTIDQTVREYP